MSLSAWQRALVALVITGDEIDACADLTDAERLWLRAAVGSPGLAITRRVQRDWRVFRLYQTLPLTVRLLGSRFQAVADDYLAACSGASSFYLAEAERFVAHLTARGARLDHVDAVSRFELSMHRAVQHAAANAGAQIDPMPGGACRVTRARVADLIEFSAPPARVLAALATGTGVPLADGLSHLMLCGARVQWQPTVAEVTAFRRLALGPVAVASIEPDVAGALWRAGAIELAAG